MIHNEETEDIFIMIVGNENEEGLNQPSTNNIEYADKNDSETYLEEPKIIKKSVNVDNDLDMKLGDNNFYDNCGNSNQQNNSYSGEIRRVPGTNVIFVQESKKRNAKTVKEVTEKEEMKTNVRKSVVAEIREKYPHLNSNIKWLVTVLVEIMKNVEPLRLPRDSYVKNDTCFTCTICGNLSKTFSAACSHYQEEHGPTYLLCYACGLNFRSTSALYKHEEECKAVDAQTVLMARAQYFGNKNGSKPIYLHHDTPKGVTLTKCTCEYCETDSDNKKKSYENDVNSVEETFLCDKCSTVFATSDAFQCHLSEHLRQREICNYCGVSFTSKTRLQEHVMDIHESFNNFLCEECGKRYYMKYSLKHHIDRAHRISPSIYACVKCVGRFSRKKFLKNHLVKNHGLILEKHKIIDKNSPRYKSMINLNSCTYQDTDVRKRRKLILKLRKPNELDQTTIPDKEPSDRRVTRSMSKKYEYIVRDLDEE